MLKTLFVAASLTGANALQLRGSETWDALGTHAATDDGDNNNNMPFTHGEMPGGANDGVDGDWNGDMPDGDDMPDGANDGVVVDHDTDGIEIQIPGNTARVVWVRANYDSFVRAGIEGLRANQFLIGEQLNRRNVTGNIFSHADNHDAPHLDASRMRSTWLAWLLNQHAPIGMILQAAGPKTARTLTDLAATTTTGTSDADSTMLRGADQ